MRSPSRGPRRRCERSGGRGRRRAVGCGLWAVACGLARIGPGGLRSAGGTWPLRRSVRPRRGPHPPAASGRPATCRSWTLTALAVPCMEEDRSHADGDVDADGGWCDSSLFRFGFGGLVKVLLLPLPPVTDWATCLLPVTCATVRHGTACQSQVFTKVPFVLLHSLASYYSM